MTTRNAANAQPTQTVPGTRITYIGSPYQGQCYCKDTLNHH
jgi:hypothetical protein